MSQAAADRNLLFGIIALQMDFISRDALIAAMHAWVLDKDKPLGQILVEQQAMGDEARVLVEPLVCKHLEKRGRAPERSLSACSPVGVLMKALQAIADPDLDHSLSHLAVPGGFSDADATESYAAGTSSETGGRFRILRPYARGGQGEVYVARDTELNREVALKQLQAEHAGYPESRARFLLEAEVTGGLEHPGVVPVYSLGCFHDGRPFYAMRFIRGDSLKDAIESFQSAEAARRPPGERSLALRQLLGRFVDVCNALSYAHSRGVLHRDLKPGNIMLGHYGETLVVDWGLAKALGRREATPGALEGTLRPSCGTGAPPTLAGQVVGTPAYMSPEQAAGRLDDLGPASDVYSLGATLYCLLAGRPPFTGRDAGTIVRQVQAGDYAPVRRVKPEVAAPLEAICQKAMSRRPEDRYASPRLLADEIERWLADEPVAAWPEPIAVGARRWMRRHRPLVTAAAATALVGLAALAIAYSRESAINARLARTNRQLDDASHQVLAANAGLVEANERVSRAKAESDRRLDQTLQAFEGYYTGIGEEVLLGESEFQSLRQRLLEKPREFYEQFARELDVSAASDERSRVLLARGRYGLARILNLLGREQEALRQAEAAVRLYRELAAARPGEAKYQHGLAWSCVARGNAQRQQSDLTAAAESHREAARLFSRLVTEHPDDPRYQESLAWSWNNLGNVEQLAGHSTVAAESLHQAIVVRAKLAGAQPGDMAYQDALAKSHTNLGVVQYETGDLTSAARSHREAIAIYTRLLASRPDMPDHVWGLAMGYTNLGIVQRDLRDRAGAVDSARHALAMWSRLVAMQPNMPRYRKGLASAYTNLGLAQVAVDDRAGASASYREAIAAWSKLTEAQPVVAEYRHGLAKCYGNLGLLQVESQDHKEAEHSFRREITLSSELVAGHPDVPDYQRALATSHHNLGTVQQAVGDGAGAGASYGRAIEVWSKLVAAHPERADCQAKLAETAGDLALLQSRAKDLDGAANSLRRAIATWSRLVAAHGDVLRYQHMLGGSYNNLAIVQRERQQPREAEESSRRAIEIHRRLCSADPADPRHTSWLGAALHSLGQALQEQGRHSEAEQAFREAIEEQHKACQKSPRSMAFRQFLSNHFGGLAGSLRLQGRTEEAAEIARRRRTMSPSNPVELYNASCELALCIPLARDAAQKEAYASEAIAALRAAIAAGWRDARQASNDADLAPLRARDDFRQLIGELFDRGFPANPFAQSR